MRLMSIVTVCTAAAALAILSLTAPADAQTRRRDTNLDKPTRITTVDETGRSRTRITVRQRSFLDPGTESKSAFEHHYHDYARPPNYMAFHDRHDWKGSWSRMPLPGAHDVSDWR